MYNIDCIPDVSVILPVYNNEKYLKVCIESVLNQSLSNIELIIVDDGSIDNTASICKKYALEDKRVKYVYQNNSGVSLARNLGINLAQGNYIAFIDSDDFMVFNMLEKMFNSFNENIDLVMCKFVKFYNRKYIDSMKVSGGNSNVISKINAAIKIHLDKDYLGYVWNKMYRKEKIVEIFLNENKDIRPFDLDIHMCEDLLFNSIYIDNCENICCLSDRLYFYFENKDGISSGKYSDKLFSEVEAYNRILSIYENSRNNINLVDEYDEIKKSVSIASLRFSINHISRMIKSGKISSEYINIYKKFIKQNIYVINEKDINRSDRILIYLFMNLPFILYANIYKIHIKLKRK